MSNNSINISVEEEDAISPGNQVLIFTQLEPQLSSSMDQTPGTTGQLTYNQSLLETLVNQNKQLIEENKNLREVNSKIYERFTEEFVGLKRSIEQVLTSFKRQRTFGSKLPSLPLTEVSEVLNFEKLVQDDEEIKQDLVTKFDKQPTDDLKKFIFFNLKSIFINDSLASNFSWTNVNNNIAVKDFKFVKVLKDSCMENIPQTNYSKIDETIKKFFNGAKDRKAKQTKRTNTQHE